MSAPVQGQAGNRPPTLTEILSARADRIRPFIPPGMDMERVLQTAWVQTKRTPKLLECTPESILLAIVRIFVWGLEVGETAYLVPFKKTCTPVAAATGLVELATASGVVKAAEAHCVYEKELDTFQMRRGLDPLLTHWPMREPVAQRGKIVGAYSMFWLRGGGAVWEYMAYEDIDQLRKQYSKQWGDLPETPAWYCRKTVLRHGVKYIPKNAKLARLLAVVNEDRTAEEEEAEVMGTTTVAEALAAPAPEPPAPPKQLGEGTAPMAEVAVPQREAVPLVKVEGTMGAAPAQVAEAQAPVKVVEVPAAPAPEPVLDLGPAPAATKASGPPPIPGPPPGDPYALGGARHPDTPRAPAPGASSEGGANGPAGGRATGSNPASSDLASPPAPHPARQLTDVFKLEPPCPTCGKEMHDNRRSKRNPKAPDFRCKDANCEGVLWPGQAEKMAMAQRRAPAAAAPAPVPAAVPAGSDEGFPAALVDEDDDLPF